MARVITLTLTSDEVRAFNRGNQATIRELGLQAAQLHESGYAVVEVEDGVGHLVSQYVRPRVYSPGVGPQPPKRGPALPEGFRPTGIGTSLSSSPGETAAPLRRRAIAKRR